MQSLDRWIWGAAGDLEFGDLKLVSCLFAILISLRTKVMVYTSSTNLRSSSDSFLFSSAANFDDHPYIPRKAEVILSKVFCIDGNKLSGTIQKAGVANSERE